MDNLGIKTWRERLFEAEPEWRNWPPDGGAVNEVGNFYKDDEIADLREALQEYMKTTSEKGKRDRIHTYSTISGVHIIPLPNCSDS